jgi:hypothetical protein
MSVVDSRLIAALKRRSAASDGLSAEKRRATRTKIRVKVDVQTFIEDRIGPWFRGEMQDVSIQGLCLNAAAPMEPGSQFVMRLPKLKGYDKPPVLVCQTVRCGPNGAGGFLIGARFTNRLDHKRIREAPTESDEARIRRAMLS